jgi:hypothetical protein
VACAPGQVHDVIDRCIHPLGCSHIDGGTGCPNQVHMRCVCRAGNEKRSRLRPLPEWVGKATPFRPGSLRPAPSDA